ncbi:MAG: hypothetical protein H0W62_04945 [Chitinophagales bacterium]|nr:hypothetical protein [Chitinophagales bacterium]
MESSDIKVFRASTKETTKFGLEVTANGPLNFCQGGNVKLTAKGNGENTYQWYRKQ